jgi:hypothetical protein
VVLRDETGGGAERAPVDHLLGAHDQRGVEEARLLLIGIETAVRLGGPGADRLRSHSSSYSSQLTLRGDRLFGPCGQYVPLAGFARPH